MLRVWGSLFWISGLGLSGFGCSAGVKGLELHGRLGVFPVLTKKTISISYHVRRQPEGFKKHKS